VPPTLVDIKESLFGEKAFMTSMDPRHGMWMSSSIIFRGQISSYESNEMAKNVLEAKSSYFVEWIPNNINNTIICDKPPRGHIMSGTMISNHTSIMSDLKSSGEKFTAMFRRKAFLHWYTGQGMDEMEFTEAESNVNDVATTY
jgi:tubulin beta